MSSDHLKIIFMCSIIARKWSPSILFQAMSKLKGNKKKRKLYNVAARGVVKVKARTRRDGNQHVSAKAWRFQNNLFQSVHSCAA